MKESLQEDFITFLSRAQRYCSLSEKCEEDVRKKLIEWKVIPVLFNDIFSSLKQEKFINEERYAKAFAIDKFRLSKWGKIKIDFALNAKKISAHYIENALDAIDMKEYLSFIAKEVSQKYASVKGKTDFERKAKVLRYMAGKGFEVETCQKFLEKSA